MNDETHPIACGECRQGLHAYLDGELAAPESAQVGRHLEDCSDCFERSQLEEAFRRSIQSRVGSAASPADPALEDRIRRTLDAEDERRSQVALAGGRPERPRRASVDSIQLWAARVLIAAATLLIAVATWTTLNVPRVEDHETVAGVQHPAFVKGRLVCLDCVMMKAKIPETGLMYHLPKAGLPSPDPSAHHRLHLRAESGRLWELFPEDEAAAALDAHDNAGREASIVGTAFPEIGVLRVARLSLD